MTAVSQRFSTFVLLSIALHAVFLLARWEPTQLQATSTRQPMQISLTAAPAAAEPVQQPAAPPPPREAPTPTPRPKPVEATPRPVPQPVTAAAEPTLEDLLQDAPAIDLAQPQMTRAATQNASFAQQFAVPVDVPNQAPLAGLEERDARQAYLDALHRHLVQSSLYPHYIQVLGIDGRVDMSLVVSGEGRLLSLEFPPGQHEMLINAARDILQGAQPLPEPPAVLGGDIAIDLPLEFTLED